MKQFMDTLKVEQKIKNQLKQATRASEFESNNRITDSQQNAQKEQDDITRFIDMVICASYNSPYIHHGLGKVFP